jgi:hypothetical protein
MPAPQSKKGKKDHSHHKKFRAKQQAASGDTQLKQTPRAVQGF